MQEHGFVFVTLGKDSDKETSGREKADGKEI